MTPSRADVLTLAARLAGEGRPFALATVVRREAPISARPGRRAVIEEDGTIHGWLGGSCIEPLVRREAAEALRDGEPRLLLFTPDPADEPDRPGIRPLPLTCHSGGTVEVYVEPEVPAPVLALFGDSPVTRALETMGAALEVRVRSVGPEDEVPDPGAAELWAVVATMGEWDEDGVERALEAGASYVGLVASSRRAAEVRRTLGLEDDGEDGDAGGRLVSPAGLDLGGTEPPEIAVAILAELVSRRHGAPGEEARRTAGETAAESPEAAGEAGQPAGAEADLEVATDPVCGMEVEVARASHSAEHDGRRYWFCCAGCRRKFEEAPERWIEAPA